KKKPSFHEQHSWPTRKSQNRLVAHTPQPRQPPTHTVTRSFPLAPSHTHPKQSQPPTQTKPSSASSKANSRASRAHATAHAAYPIRAIAEPGRASTPPRQPDKQASLTYIHTYVHTYDRYSYIT
ncbi:uncharacterized protein K452DRAFT_316884, partial [Aplosporella prunicola CBS 121167]